MSTDVAGNYIFSVEGHDYRIMKMNVFQQRELLRYIQPVVRTDGQIDVFGEYSEEAQDYLMPLISYQDGDKFTPLTKDNLIIYIEQNSKGKSQINFMLNIFSQAVSTISEAFFPEGDTLTPENSGQAQEASSEPEQEKATTSSLERTLQK